MHTMKFIPRFLLLILILFVFAQVGFLIPSDGFAAAASTNAPRVAPKIMEAAEKGDPAAQTQVANFYATGDRDLRDHDEALKWYRRAAEQGYAPAQVRLGMYLLLGAAVKQDITQAWSWLRKAADQNDTFALYMAGRASEEGIGRFKKDDTEAGQWYRKSADYGYALAQYHLGRLCAEGHGMPRDDIEALKWFELVDLQKTDFSRQLDLIEANNKARLQLIERMSAKDDAEARRRAAAFGPKTPFTNDYWITYWNDLPIMPRTGPIGPITVSFMGRTQVIDTTSFPFLGGNVSIQTSSSGFSPNPAPAPPVPRNNADLFVEVPVRIEDNRPYVSVKVNGGKSVRLLFDSGCHMTYFREKIATKLKLKPTEKMRVGNDFVDVVEGVTLEVGKASFAPPRVGIDLHDSFRMLSPFEDGILGADFLQNYVVELDYRKGKMRLRDPFRYKYTGPGDYLLIRLLHGTPILDARIIDGAGRSITASFLIDTGFTGTLSLEEELWKGKGVKDSLGRTLSGSVAGFKGRRPTEVGELNGFQLGHYYFPEPRTLFREPQSEPAGFSGLIGGNILRRFTVIFHYGRQQLILIPNGLPLQPTVMQDSASQLNK